MKDFARATESPLFPILLICVTLAAQVSSAYWTIAVFLFTFLWMDYVASVRLTGPGAERPGVRALWGGAIALVVFLVSWAIYNDVMHH